MKERETNEWDQIYSSQGRRAEYPDEFVIRFVNRHLVDMDSNGDSPRVLDLGCGPGRHVAYLARERFDTYGIDYSRVAIDMAQDLCARNGLEADVRRESLVELSFEDEFFDSVIDCATIQHNHLEEIDTGLSEVNRVLKPGGLFLWKARSREDSFYGEGNEPEAGTCVFPQESVVREEKDTVEKPTHFFTKEELLGLLRDDFSDVHVEYTERTFDEMEGKIAHYIVVAKK